MRFYLLIATKKRIDRLPNRFTEYFFLRFWFYFWFYLSTFTVLIIRTLMSAGVTPGMRLA